MHPRTVTAALAATLLLTAAGTAAAQPVAQGTGKAEPRACRANQVRLSASAAEPEEGLYPNVVRIKVTNVSGKRCAVDRLPTVAFGELDGPALAVPPGESGPYALAPGTSGYAAVRTIEDPTDPDTRFVDYITVAGAPAHPGARFTAEDLGIPDRIRVWEPITTWWQTSQADADEVLADQYQA